MLVMQAFLRVSLIIGLLLALALGPITIAGYNDLALAASLSSPHEQSVYYESAAQRLPWAAYLYETSASAAMRAGDYERAIALFQVAQRKSALSPNGQFELGWAYFLLGERSQALDEWQAIPSGNPATASAGPYLADGYHAQARFDDEERTLRQWLALDPQNADAQYRLGLLLFADASPEALPLLEFVASASPELKPAADGLRVALKTALEAGAPAAALTYCGQTLAAIGEWPLALRTFSRATQADPSHAPAWAWLGEARQHVPEGGDPLEALQRAVSLAPGSAQVQVVFGLYWQRQADWEKARQAFETAAQLEPQNPAWQISLGQIYVQLGNLVTALDYYQDAVELAPNDSRTWRALALFSVENDVDLETIARDAALRAYALEPENAQNMDALGRALLATQQYDAAETFFKKAIEAAPGLPSSAAPAYHLALLYMETNRRDLAEEYLRSARALDPDGPLGAQAARVLERYFP